MDQTDRHPADQLALKAASLLATSSPRPASPRSPRRQSRRHNDPPRKSIMGRRRSVWRRLGASTHEPRTYDCFGDLYGQDPI